MIREGGATKSANSNVLTGTQFSQITSPMMLTVRCKDINITAPSGTATTVNFQTDHRYEFIAGAVVLSTGVLNQVAAAGRLSTTTANSVETGMTQQPVGLTGNDVIFKGMVQPGTLQLNFSGADSSHAVHWDVTAA